MRTRPCVRQLTVSLGWTGKDAVEEGAAASVCASLSYNAIPVTVSDGNTHTHWGRGTPNAYTHTNVHKMSLHTQWVLSDAQSWMCLCRQIYLISWEVMMLGFKNLKSTLRGRGEMWCVILNTQSLGVTILSPWRIYLSTLHRHKFPVYFTVWYCVYKMERESHTTGEQLFAAHTDLVKL